MSDIFEQLRERAGGRGDLSIGCGIGITATIEALKEMMVGEPMMGWLIHRSVQEMTGRGENKAKGTMWAEVEVVGRTEVMPFPSCGAEPIATFNDHYGVDGEEVWVFVVRKEEK